MSRGYQFVLQLLVLLVVCTAAYFLAFGFETKPSLDGKAPASPKSDVFDMLGYLDDQIACQEAEKDVRCWSSVNKLQMFVAGATIDHEAISCRIESYHNLVDNIWQKAASDDQTEISTEQLMRILRTCFPHNVEQGNGAIRFEFNGDEPVLVMQELANDYADTIEPWRILQSWAASHVNEDGTFGLTPVFSEPSVNAFHEFLVSFDIALLRRAKQIANNRKRSTIDAESMRLAFQFEDCAAPTPSLQD